MNTLRAHVPAIADDMDATAGVPARAALPTDFWLVDDGQTAAPGASVALPPTVVVVTGDPAHWRCGLGNNEYCLRLSGVPVSFLVVAGGGEVTRASGVTDAAGEASCGDWTLGPDVGVNTLSVALVGVSPSDCSRCGAKQFSASAVQ
jgi:hypothetical protein